MYNWQPKIKGGLIFVLALMFVLSFSVVTVAEDEVPYGGWLDTVILTEEDDESAAIERLLDDDIQIHAETLDRSDIKERVEDEDELYALESYGSYEEIALNTAGTGDEPYFDATGDLNPFANENLREALNWLVDREYIVEEIYDGLGQEKFTPISTAGPDYARYIDIHRQIEIEYDHDAEKAEEIIEDEMLAMGAEKIDGTWHYDGEPVVLTGLIRTEDLREDVGDYVSDLFVDLGFEVERRYGTSADLSPLWMTGDPHAGEWSFYTGGWVSPVVYRDEGWTFDFLNTPRGLPRPLWQVYDPPEELDEAYLRLDQRDFTSMEERRELMETALWGSMENAKSILYMDSEAFSPLREEVSIAHDYSGNISGAMMWAHTVRYEDEVGGMMEITLPSVMTEPWNPTDGSNWVFDTMVKDGITEYGYMFDPYTGLNYPNYFDSATVKIQEGYPVDETLDWVDLEFISPEESEVPEDAWYQWDAEEERFMTVGEVMEENPDEFDEHPPQAIRTVRTTYDLEEMDVHWHDGSELTVGDFVYSMILWQDRAQEESDIYDTSIVPDYESAMDTFLGFEIVEEDPLVIDYYSDLYYLDAEMYTAPVFPIYDQSGGAWHNMGVAFRAEAEELVTHTASKADELDVERVNYIGGPSLDILDEQLEEASAENYIPFENTLGEYVSEEEAAERYENLREWYEEKDHFMVGFGPYYLEEAHPVEGIVELNRYEDYAFPADRWDMFEEAMIPELEVSGPDSIMSGDEAEFDVSVTFEDEPFASENIIETTYLLFDANDNLVAEGELEEVAEGEWKAVLASEETEELVTGPSRLEVIISPLTVATPSISTTEFVTIGE